MSVVRCLRVALLGLAVSVRVLAAAPESETDRIAAERAAAQAKFAQQERECQAKFVVSPCVEAARSEQRATLARLRDQELRLAEAKRREAAAMRRQEIRDRTEAQAKRAADLEPVHESAGHAAPQPHPPVAPHASAPRASAADRLAAEQRNTAQFEAKARAAQAHREAVEQRNALRAAQGKVAAPLPVPSSGASAPSR